MVLPEQTTVLVVGAGPTGVSAALSLLEHGVKDIVIVDAAERTPDTSRAMAVHAATLEALESIGCADKMVELGLKASQLDVWDRKQHIFSLEVTKSLEAYTKYPFLLEIPQNKTEEVLEERLESLGLYVHRPLKAVGMKGDVDELGNTEVSFESGEVVKAQYVIGADGARSVIRQVNGISFGDPDGLPVDDSIAQIVLADVVFSDDRESLPKQNAQACVHDNAFSLIIPLPKASLDDSQDQIYRIAFNIPGAKGAPPSRPDLPYLQAHFDAVQRFELTSDPAQNPKPLCMTRVLWSSRFRTHAAIAEKTVIRLHERTDTLGGYVFLVGDAAHIHSPAGGQGMNLGIRDAIGLGKVLSEHLKSTPGDAIAHGKAPPLQVFAEERRNSALKVIRLTKRIMGAVTVLSGTGSVINLQYWLLRLLGCIPFFRRMVAWQVSGLGNR